MTIICGFDFSNDAERAADVAALFAKRLGTSLTLVHVYDGPALDPTLVDPRDPEIEGRAHEPLRHRLEQLAEGIHRRMDVPVSLATAHGVPWEELVDLTLEREARLVVLGALGRGQRPRWLLGSVAERVAQASTVPVLVVRDPASLEAWAAGARPLRVMAAVELTPPSKAALRWVEALREIGPVDVEVVEVAWPFGEHHRLGVPPPMPLDELRPELREPLLRDLRAFTGELAGPGRTTFAVHAGWGRVDEHLCQLAAESRVDLVVVGAHQRSTIARLWQGSVSRGVLHAAPTNVASIPRSALVETSPSIPSFKSVLVSTDFSELANRAIPFAYGLVAPGGTVHLFHVRTRRPGEDDPDPRTRLAELVPRGAAARGVTSSFEAVSAEQASTAIAQAAERLGVDAIVLATHGRSGVSRLVLGSQASALVSRTTKPVLLVPPSRPA